MAKDRISLMNAGAIIGALLVANRLAASTKA